MQENENSQHYTSRNWKIRGIIFLTGKGMRESGAPPPTYQISALAVAMKYLVTVIQKLRCYLLDH